MAAGPGEGAAPRVGARGGAACAAVSAAACAVWARSAASHSDRTASQTGCK